MMLRKTSIVAGGIVLTLTIGARAAGPSVADAAMRGDRADVLALISRRRRERAAGRRRHRAALGRAARRRGSGDRARRRRRQRPRGRGSAPTRRCISRPSGDRPRSSRRSSRRRGGRREDEHRRDAADVGRGVWRYWRGRGAARRRRERSTRQEKDRLQTPLISPRRTIASTLSGC